MKELRTYHDNYEHLDDSLLLLDTVIYREIQRIRKNTALIENRQRNSDLFISEAEVDLLLQNERQGADTEEINTTTRQIETLGRRIGKRSSGSNGVFLALPRLAQLFALSDFEILTIVICLAPELNRKYDKLYAYIQDDITRKTASVDLVLQLLCETGHEKWSRLAFFHASASLFRFGLIEKINDACRPSGSSRLSCLLKLSRRILDFILGNSILEESLFRMVTVHTPDPDSTGSYRQTGKDTIINLLQQRKSEKNIFYIYGQDERGIKETVLSVAAQVNIPLLYADLTDVLANRTDPVRMIQDLTREARLMQGALFISNIDLLCNDENLPVLIRRELQEGISRYSFLTFLSGREEEYVRVWFKDLECYAVYHEIPDSRERERIWKKELAMVTVVQNGNQLLNTAEALSVKYKLDRVQIHRAVKETVNQVRMKAPSEIDFQTLCSFCRKQTNYKLGKLAQRIISKKDWDDLILPEKKKNQLKDLCLYIDKKEYVFQKWGFADKYSYGKGFSILFSGLPGTGKTLSAEILAGESQLDLYKIDLSRVVSKYIGETEKNLSAVFREAERTSSILFFDEADALFAKRTEIADAHDRYANIETGFLLQKIEEYEGVVILATNMKENIDAAFTRRLKFIVDFPFPDPEMRLLIWKTLFPAQTPLADDIDFNFLAAKYNLSGGNIKNIVLHAALLGASNGKIVRMKDILTGVRREYEKIGRIWN